MKSFARDMRVALRSLFRRPVFAAGAVLSLALGIGANTAIFTCVNAILLRPLPVENPAELMMVYATSSDSPGDLFGLSYLNFVDYLEGNEVFTSMLVFRPVNMRLGGSDRPEAVTGEMVSGNYFDLLGVRPALGRAFLPEEDGAPGRHPVTVLSHGLWQRRFGGDPEVIGKTIPLNRQAYTIIGVAPEGFRGVVALGSPELWIPAAMHEQVLFGRLATWWEKRDALFLNVVGRLEPGVSRERAETELQTLARRLEQEYLDNKGLGVTLAPLSEATIHHSVRGSFVLAGEVLMVLVGVLLLITCANVANLLLARALERRKEIAVRLSIGAGRGRLVRQLITEGLALSFLGGLVGLGLARLGRDLLWSLRPPIVPETLDVSLDARVLAFTFVLCVLTGVIFGLVPLAQAFRFELLPALKDTGAALPQTSRRLSLRHLLVVAQVALSFVSLVGAGLFLSSLRNARQIDPGFEPEHVALVALDLGMQGYDETAGRELQRRVIERVEALPGVRSAAFAERVMLDLRGMPRRDVTLEGQEPPPNQDLMIQFNTVGQRYFETLGIAIRQGRGFTAADREDAPRVVVVNETMAHRFWPGRPAVGQRFRLGDPAPVEVVGVAGDVKVGGMRQPSEPYIYVPLLQSYAPAATLHLRAEGDPAAVLPAVRQAVKDLDATLPLSQERTMMDLIEQSLWASRTAAGLLTAFGLLALLLAGTGIYSTMAFTVRSRFREMGIRTALGARQADLLKLMMREGVFLVIGGIALGATAAVLALPWVSGLLFGAGDANLPVFTVATLVLVAVSLLANLVPARRAMSVEPSLVLRQE